MRIVGGALKNRMIKGPIGFKVRPTSEKIREAFFNILGNNIEGVKFLDLFAGSGSVGIEALSRGASKVLFVENRNSSIKILKNNLKSLQLEEMTRVIHFDVLNTIKTLNNRQLKYNIIFIDPPYNSSLLSKTLHLMVKYPIMEQGAQIVSQSFFKTTIPSFAKLKQIRQEKYGETLLSFFSWEGA